jgi:hypothetical protein
MTARSKTCNKCGLRKPLSDFYKQVGMRDGHRNNCKVCHLAAHKKWYTRDREYEIARVGTWQRGNAERVNEVQRRNRARRGGRVQAIRA